MAYDLVETNEGIFAVDVKLIEFILSKFARAKAQYENARLRNLQHPEYARWNPLSWGLPNVHEVEVDWQRVKAEAGKEKARLASEFFVCGPNVSFRDLRNQLVYMLGSARMYKEKFFDLLHQAQRRTMKEIDSSVGHYTAAKEVARGVRDISAGTLIVGASLMSGGAAAATLGGGSILKGTGKYQDTSNVGAAVLEAATSFTIGLIPAPGASAAVREKVLFQFTMAKLEAQRSTVISLVEGKSISHSATDAIADRGVSGLSGPACKAILGDPKGIANLKRLSVPGVVAIVGTAACNFATSKARGAAVDAVFEESKTKVSDRRLPQAVEPLAAALFAEEELAHRAIVGPNHS